MVGFVCSNVKSRPIIAGVWKVVFRRLAAKQPFFNWELRFSVAEQLVGGGETVEQVEGGDQAKEDKAEGEDGAPEETKREASEEAGAGGELEGDGDEGRGGHRGKHGMEEQMFHKRENNYKRWVARLLQLEERWTQRGSQPHLYVHLRHSDHCCCHRIHRQCNHHYRCQFSSFQVQ